MIDRRTLLVAAAGLAPAISRARAIDADSRTGTIRDVQHVVILMQENRSFDHYFGAMNGVRGFADRFPIPVPGTIQPGDGWRTVWTQCQTTGTPAEIAPFHLDTEAAFAQIKIASTPHTWPDTQAAWDQGRMSHWPDAKTPRAMSHYKGEDLPFQYALADAFTVCDAYHCSIQTGTNTNRLFLWTGTNDPGGKHGGPAIGNSHDNFASKGGWAEPYTWTTYPERLQAAGVDWRIYQDMADNFTDNPLAGFKTFRDAYEGKPGANPELAARGLSTQHLDRLKADVVAGRLPQVSWVIAPAADSEHPAASSPVQGADYTARVIDALTADPRVWSRTVLLVMFDENDGLFDHAPPPAPPSRDPEREAGYLGASTVDTEGEYHLVPAPGEPKAEKPELIGRPYGLGPRVPMYVISPWSRGGWVNSQVFDHTSVIRFLEARFGVEEPNISSWRRAVCGDLTTCFDFRSPNKGASPRLPETATAALKAKPLGHVVPPTPAVLKAPVQAEGVRPSRALPYQLDALARVGRQGVELSIGNAGEAGAVLHVYDRTRLAQIPRRYTVGAGRELSDRWTGEDYDLWLLGPAGFHRHFAARAGPPGMEASAVLDRRRQTLTLRIRNFAAHPSRITASPMAYAGALHAFEGEVPAGGEITPHWSLKETHGWYDLALHTPTDPAFLRRFAGRLETGRDSITDPAMGGPALMVHPL
jgi:phospholipase C